MVAIVIQARMGSTRLPGKVLRPLSGRPVLQWVARAAHESAVADRVIVATTHHPDDDAIPPAVDSMDVEIVRGDKDDVLSRFLMALEGAPAREPVVRLTADCPLLDPAVIRACVRAFQELDVDYLGTTIPRSLPRGLDVEVTSVEALTLAGAAASGADRTHVTSYLYRDPGRFRLAGITFTPPANDLRVTLDTPEDFVAIEAIVEALGDRSPSWEEVVALLRTRPDIVEINSTVRQKPVDEG